MNDITALAKTLRLAAESEIAHRAEGDTSDLWQDETSPENVLALVEALEKAQAITAAAEKLVRCKGRYHSEQNYRALAALFGVKTPDLPQLESESRTVTAAASDVLAERQRQISMEGWKPEHDDEHVEGQLSDAAACYALFATDQRRPVPSHWPWSDDWWKQRGQRRDLVRAGALIIAEIERLDRASGIQVIEGEGQ